MRYLCLIIFMLSSTAWASLTPINRYHCPLPSQIARATNGNQHLVSGNWQSLSPVPAGVFSDIQFIDVWAKLPSGESRSIQRPTISISGCDYQATINHRTQTFTLTNFSQPYMTKATTQWHYHPSAEYFSCQPLSACLFAAGIA